MRRVRLPGTDLEVSRGAFGTARLHRMPGRAEREQLLRAALDAGFTHFDTAPLYGFGLAEEALGALSDANITVATKVGLYPPGRGERGSALGTALRKVAGKFVPSLSRARVSADIARAEHSLTQSLKRLRRETVDILFIHEPDPALFDTDEWRAWREREAGRGRVRHFGLAGAPEHLLGWSAGGWTGLLQTRDTDGSAHPLRASDHTPQLTYGLLGGDGALEAGLARNPDGAVVVSSRDPARLAARLGD